MLVFFIVMVKRRFNRFLVTGIGNVHIGRFTVKVKPGVTNFGGKRARCILQTFPLNNTYVFRKRSKLRATGRRASTTNAPTSGAKQNTLRGIPISISHKGFRGTPM